MTASRGPIPKREDERRRRNKPDDGMAVDRGEGFEPTPMEPDDDWHPIAYNLYLGLSDSGQHVFYEQSDWDLAYLLCEQISMQLKPTFHGMSETWNRDANQMERKPVMMVSPMKGGDLGTILKGFGNLMATEGDRRRMRLELDKAPTGPAVLPANVTAINAAREKLGLGA